MNRATFAPVATALPAVGALIGALVAALVGLAAALDPGGVHGLIGILIASAAVFYWLDRRPNQEWADPHWRRLVIWVIGLRLLAGVAHFIVAFYILGQMVDFIGFHEAVVRSSGGFLTIGVAQFVADRFDPTRMVQFIMVAFMLLVGDNLFGMLIISALIGLLGSYLLLRGFQVGAPPGSDVAFLGKILFFLPTFVFWASLFGKECVVFFCLGGVTYCFARLLERVRLRHVIGGALCLGVLTVIRSHVGVILALALGVGWVLRPSKRLGTAGVFSSVRLLFRFLVLGAVLLGPVAVLINVQGVDSIGGLARRVVLQSEVLSTAFADITPGTASSLPPVLTGESYWEFVQFIPEGFVTFLFRPFPFEAHNIPLFIAGLEGLVFIAIVLRRRRHLIAAVRAVRHNAFLAYCVTYFFFGTWMLSFERNLGAIVRHRIMTLPFLFILLAVALRPAPAANDDGKGAAV